jgi:hypothetical protein
MECVPLWRLGLAGMASRALTVIEAVGQRIPDNIPVSLAVGIVATHTCHGSVEIAIAEQMSLLIRKRLYTAIGMKLGVSQQRKLQRVVLLKRCARRETRLQHILNGVALKTNEKRFVLRQGRERSQPDVSRQTSAPCKLDMALSGTMAGLAIDGKRRNKRLVLSSMLVISQGNLTSVALLTVGESGIGTKHSCRGPVGAFG